MSEKANGVLIRKRGRPLGSVKSKGPSVRNWQPIKWKDVYEVVLLMHVCNKTNKEIAEATDYSEGQIDNILNSEVCKERMKGIVEKLGLGDVIGRHKYLMELSIKKMEEFLMNDKVFKDAPISAIGQAMKIYEVMGEKVNPSVKGGNVSIQNNIQNNTLSLATEENVNRLMEASKFANKVAELNGKPIQTRIPADTNIPK